MPETGDEMGAPGPTVADQVAWLVDQQSVRDVVARYCRGIDRLDMELVRDCYHPGALDHHTGFDGPVEEFLTWVQPQLARLGGTHHMIGNQLVELHGDEAVAESYAIATHWSHTGERGNLTTGVRYVDHLSRRQGRWAITERWAVRDWGRAESAGFLPQGDGPAAGRGSDDPLNKLREQLGLGSARQAPA